MKHTYYYICLLLTILGMAACTSHDVEGDCKPTQDELGIVRIHIGAGLGVSTRQQGSLDTPIVEGDDKISSLNVYLLKEVNNQFVSCRNDQQPCFSQEYDTPVDQAIIEVDKKLLELGGTYYVLVLANMKYVDYAREAKLFTETGELDLDSYYLFSETSSSKYPKSGQFPMSNSNSYIGDDVRSFLNQYKFEFKEEASTEDIEVFIRLDRALACVKMKNGEDALPVSSHLQLEDGLSLVYENFTVFNFHRSDFLFKRLAKDTHGDTYINKCKELNEVALSWSYFFKADWSTIQGDFNKEVKLLSENGPYSNSIYTKPTQGTASGVLIRVVGFKNGKEVELYARQEGDSYKLCSGVPSKEDQEQAIVYEYPHGMFYTFYIKEPNLPLKSGEPHYGVVRNTAYLLTIKMIKNLGGVGPFEDLPNPDEDSGIREDVSNIELHVQPWYEGTLNFN